MIVYEIECQECNATYEIKHHLNTSRYDIVYCSFCNSDNVEIEDPDNPGMKRFPFGEIGTPCGQDWH